MPRISDQKELLNDLNLLKKGTIPPSILPYWTITTNLACAIQNGLQTNTEKFKRSWLFFFIIHLSKRISSEQFQPPLLQSKEGVQLLQFLGLARMTHDSFLELLSMIESHPVFQKRSRNPQAPASHQLLVALAHFGLSGNGGAIAMLSEVFNVSEGSIANFTNRTLQAILNLEDRYFLLADSAYTATDTVVPAFKQSGGLPLPKSKQDFNYQLSSRRVAIKQCIGILRTNGNP
ncbi:hypothetical protein PSHT_16316, partial [Puccinia striiformis]